MIIMRTNADHLGHLKAENNFIVIMIVASFPLLASHTPANVVNSKTIIILYNFVLNNKKRLHWIQIILIYFCFLIVINMNIPRDPQQTIFVTFKTNDSNTSWHHYLISPLCLLSVQKSQVVVGIQNPISFIVSKLLSHTLSIRKLRSHVVIPSSSQCAPTKTLEFHGLWSAKLITQALRVDNPLFDGSPWTMW